MQEKFKRKENLNQKFYLKKYQLKKMQNLKRKEPFKSHHILEILSGTLVVKFKFDLKGRFRLNQKKRGVIREVPF